MNILIFYTYRPGTYNYRCNIDFYKNLNNINGVKAFFYGPNVEQLYPDMTLTDYNKNLTLSQLWEYFQFDVIICAGYNRMFYTATEKDCWLPSDFLTFPCNKVLIEPDYHKYRKLSWIQNANFQLICHRHKSNVLRAIEDFPSMNHVWLPFSVDMNIFKDIGLERSPKVAFVGSSKSHSYYFRTQAINVLEKTDLLGFCGMKKDEEYLDILNKYLVYLNGSSIYSIDCAKAFEILASGGILLTNDVPNGFENLFKDCYIKYKNDFSDIEYVTRKILENTILQEKLKRNAIKKIKKYHTHEIRSKQLYYHIKNNLKIKPSYNHSEIVDVVYVIGNLTEDAWERFKYSYESLKLNDNFNVKISEIGKSSNEEHLKTFIDTFEYYYQPCDFFDASIAKNNAFRYLIKNNLFVFMDIDMLVPSNFIKSIKLYYYNYKKAFICAYKRLIDTSLKTYNQIIDNINELGGDLIADSGILVCSKEIYKKLNGFDEEYQGWGGRDSDFYMRAKLANLFKTYKDICLLHQYHPRQFGEHKEDNRNRYRYRLNQCSRNPKELINFKGLEDNTLLKKEMNTYEKIALLIENGINVCLLKETCYKWVIENTISDELEIAVSDIQKSKELLNTEQSFNTMPIKTKNINMSGLKVKVPFPVVSYLGNLYGSRALKGLNK